MIDCVLRTIDYIEANLDRRLGLEQVAGAVHYSKFHLHRTFADTVGMSIHSYIQRRRLTEAARLLTGSALPILDIALIAGYESQQSFSKIFKAMYKQTPRDFRRRGAFYPLQLPFALGGHGVLLEGGGRPLVEPATAADIPGWMELVRLAVDGFPFLREEEYAQTLARYIHEGRALTMKHHGIVTGVLLFGGSRLDFFAVHPFYRRHRAAGEFLAAAGTRFPPGGVSTTTYRAGDKADLGCREFLMGLGFREDELLTEFGYPTQRFVLDTRKTA